MKLQTSIYDIYIFFTDIQVRKLDYTTSLLQKYYFMQKRCAQ